jgi:hypothetical protein
MRYESRAVHPKLKRGAFFQDRCLPDRLGDVFEFRAARLHDAPYWTGTAPFRYDSPCELSSRPKNFRQSCPSHLEHILRAGVQRSAKHGLLICMGVGHHSLPSGTCLHLS